VQLNAALRALQIRIFLLALLRPFQAMFESIEKLPVPFGEVDIFSRPLQQSNEISKAVPFFVHRLSLLRPRETHLAARDAAAKQKGHPHLENALLCRRAMRQIILWSFYCRTRMPPSCYPRGSHSRANFRIVLRSNDLPCFAIVVALRIWRLS
jgi:hypothetical protein